MKKCTGILTIVLFLSMILSVGRMEVRAEDNKSYEMMKEYYNVANTIVNGDDKGSKGIGIYTSGENNSKNASGLAYANLIDFDGNGNKELFCLYLSNGSYVYEVWGFDGKAYKIQSAKDTTLYPLRENKIVSLSTVDNKTYLHMYEKSWGRGSSIDQITTRDEFYTVKNKQWVEIESLNSKPKLSEGKDSTQLNGKDGSIIYTVEKDNETKEMTKSEYENDLNKYSGGTKIDLISLALGGAGTVDIGVDVSQGNKQLGDFLSNLNGMAMESLGLKDIYSAKTDEDKDTLKEFMNNFVPSYGWHVNSFDTDNFTKGNIDDQIVFYLFRYGSMKKEITGVKTETNSDTGKGCWVIPLDKLNANSEKLFGAKIDVNNKNVHDGNYYLYIGNDDEGEESGKVDNQIANLYQIAENVYCLNLKIFYSYSHKQFYKSGYAIVKEVTVNGNKTFQLLKYSNDGDMLTPEQLQSYKKQYNSETKVTKSASSATNNNVGSKSSGRVAYLIIAGISILVVGYGIYYKTKGNKKK
ncbi:hypothetical protein [Clostridium drakei]|uniref:Uncharacterized protein n=1 Tax=Clostridium drakei TaxID=332101 RepID=A0A2U8DVP3_9CLOT|nr:hypothetical protein [Clostridium drakei]AWI06748.1 hypothetical protein B9W14_20355 [Clostridium drakei]